MPKPKAHPPLKILLNGRLVGYLKKSNTGAIDFKYDESWLSWESSIPVSLSLPLREDRYVGEPVIAVFDNLLPDNEAIRRRLATRVRAEGKDAYSLLTAVGRDCVGALQFLPEEVEPAPVGQIEGHEVSDEQIATVLGDLGSAPLGVTQNEEFRISLAGAQEKTALLRWRDHWWLPTGTTATTHILKPAIGKLENGLDLSLSVENEHFCMTFMSALGFNVAKTEIRDFAAKRVLIVERFDRLWTGDGRLLRLPQEDCCQSLSIPPSIKYQSDGGPGIKDILELLTGSDDPENDQKVFLKAQICFWLLGATDGHAKNFSVFLNPGGRFHLTPIYDVMSAQLNVDEGKIRRNQFRLAMAVGENRHYIIDTILPRHFQQTAKKASVSTAAVTNVFEELLSDIPIALEKTLSALSRESPEKLNDSIAGGIRTRLENVKLSFATH